MPASLGTSELGTVSPLVVETVSCFPMCLLKRPQAPSREGGELLKPGAGPLGGTGLYCPSAFQGPSHVLLRGSSYTNHEKGKSAV